MELWTALVLGFVGSFHCVGMCGPIVLSLPRTSTRFASLSINAITYNLGRVLTYSIFGLLFGLLGRRIALAGFQSILSITLGVTIIAVVLAGKKFTFLKNTSLYTSFVSKITKLYSTLIRKSSLVALFGMGILNGLLPCAFVYTGLAAAVLTETPWHSMFYMAFFGFGTIPAMFTIYMAPKFVSLDLRAAIRKYLPYMALSLGIFLIIRGIALQDLKISNTILNGIDSFCIFPGTGES